MIVLTLSAAAWAQNPPATTASADSTVDWLLNQPVPTSTRPPATAPAVPATIPASGDTSPLTSPARKTDARPATLTLSDGSVVHGQVTTTTGKPVRVWDAQASQYVDIPFKAIVSAEAAILWERDEKEWHFIESGSDVKEYTGRTYPARETTYQFTLTSGKTVSGGTVTPLYVTTPQGERLLVLHKRDKGPVGQTLKDLIYVKTIRFSD